jgi:hypothetical protein
VGHLEMTELEGRSWRRESDSPENIPIRSQHMLLKYLHIPYVIVHGRFEPSGTSIEVSVRGSGQGGGEKDSPSCLGWILRAQNVCNQQIYQYSTGGKYPGDPGGSYETGRDGGVPRGRG